MKMIETEVHTLAAALRMPEAVAVLDLEAVKYKLVKEEAWTLERCDQVELLYKGFLSLIALFPEETHVPTQDIDEMWHTHILDTRKYMADCMAMFGSYLHHYPYLGLMGAEDKAKAEAMFDFTRSRMNQLGIDLDAVHKAGGCGGGGGCGGSSGCSSSSCSSGGHSDCPTPSTPSHDTGYVPVTSCGGSTSNDRSRPANDRGKREEEKPRRRGWLPRLGFSWEISVDPATFGEDRRPGRAEVEALAAGKRTLN